MLQVEINDLLFVYHRDERGWTYGELVSKDIMKDKESGKSNRETVGWFPTSILAGEIIAEENSTQQN